MDLVLCHRTADFDALGAAVGIACWHPGTRIVLTGGAHPTVQQFLSLYRDEYPLLEQRSVTPEQIRSLTVVDAQRRELLGKSATWLDLPGITVNLFDHHPGSESDIFTADMSLGQVQVESVGATTTLIVEHLQRQQIALSPAAATAMALGIHVDTGSLTYDYTSVRDAAALTWLMSQGANQKAIGQFIEPGLSPMLQTLLPTALEQLQTQTQQGYQISSVLLTTEDYTPGMSGLAGHLMAMLDCDCLLLGNTYGAQPPGASANPQPQERKRQSQERERLTVIGRSRIEGLDLQALFQPWGGGGHTRAAALTVKTANPVVTLAELCQQLLQRLPQPPTARTLMSAPVRTIRPETSIDQARRILLRYGHSGLSVVNEAGQLQGVISRRDLDVALHHGFGHASVKGYMSAPVRTITPETLLPEIEALMVTYDIGRLPVLDAGQLVGIVTRTDVLRQLFHLKPTPPEIFTVHRSPQPAVRLKNLQQRLEAQIPLELQKILTTAAERAAVRGWQLYLVGGAVRDLLLTPPDQPLPVQEFDLVVDGAERLPVKNLPVESLSEEAAPGSELARELQQAYPDVQLQVYGQFQTAALHWGTHSPLQGFSVDIATARTEFYPYPAAHPQVSASSIRQDLYRRDFTINALAVRLTPPQPGTQPGELLDYFGGQEDLAQRWVRVLHPNSFVEDPTRIFRAVRFAIRLGFVLEPQTEAYIRYALASGIYERTQASTDKLPSLQSRLKNELKYLLQSQYWEPALELLSELGALSCLHPSLQPDPELWRRLRLAARWQSHLEPATAKASSVPTWELMLEALIAHLAHPLRLQVATQLHLSSDSQSRLQALEPLQRTLETALPQLTRPSQIYQLLAPYELPLLILAATQLRAQLRQKLWRYLKHWRQVKPLLDGKDLQKLGYSPGPQFRPILDALLAATLDSEIQTREEAVSFVREKYPLSETTYPKH
jgi:tRNA nucleotidyltransferase (CCA-adding enzyme)